MCHLVLTVAFIWSGLEASDWFARQGTCFFLTFTPVSYQQYRMHKSCYRFVTNGKLQKIDSVKSCIRCFNKTH